MCGGGKEEGAVVWLSLAMKNGGGYNGGAVGHTVRQIREASFFSLPPSLSGQRNALSTLNELSSAQARVKGP